MTTSGSPSALAHTRAGAGDNTLFDGWCNPQDRVVIVVGCYFVACCVSAARAAEMEHDTFAAIGFITNRNHYPFAIVLAVTGLYVHVERVEAMGAVITAGAWRCRYC